MLVMWVSVTSSCCLSLWLQSVIYSVQLLELAFAFKPWSVFIFKHFLGMLCELTWAGERYRIRWELEQLWWLDCLDMSLLCHSSRSALHNIMQGCMELHSMYVWSPQCFELHGGTLCSSWTGGELACCVAQSSLGVGWSNPTGSSEHISQQDFIFLLLFLLNSKEKSECIFLFVATVFPNPEFFQVQLSENIKLDLWS